MLSLTLPLSGRAGPRGVRNGGKFRILSGPGGVFFCERLPLRVPVCCNALLACYLKCSQAPNRSSSSISSRIGMPFAPIVGMDGFNALERSTAP